MSCLFQSLTPVSPDKTRDQTWSVNVAGNMGSVNSPQNHKLWCWGHELSFSLLALATATAQCPLRGGNWQCPQDLCPSGKQLLARCRFPLWHGSSSCMLRSSLQVSAAGTPCEALPILLAYLKLVHSVALDVLIQLLQLPFVLL